MIKVDGSVFDLARELIHWPIGIQSSCFTGNACFNEVCKASETTKVSTTCSDNGVRRLLEHEENVSVTMISDSTVTRPVDLFHLGFTYPTFAYDMAKEKAVPVLASDHLAQYMATRFQDSSSCFKHLLEIEQMLHSIMCGCYCFAILPDGWMSDQMRYNKWINANSSIVAKVKLPHDAVRMHHTFPDNRTANVLSGNLNWTEEASDDFCCRNQGWSLVVWFKGMVKAIEDGVGFDLPNTGRRNAELEWAEMSYSAYSCSMKDTTCKSIDDIVNAFRETEWYKFSIFQWRKAIATSGYSSPLNSTRRKAPVGIRADSNMIILKAPEESMSKYEVIDSISDIPDDKLGGAVILKPTRGGLKLCGATRSGNGIACRVKDLYGYKGDDETIVPNIKIEHRRDFDTIRFNTVKLIEEAGGTAFMLNESVRPLTRRRRRVNRQLAAIPRYSSTGKRSESLSKFAEIDDADWTRVWGEIGIESLFPEEYAEWRSRAKRSGIDSRFNYPYQVEDIIQSAVKRRMVNGSFMGLGKTREQLQAAMLRGAEKILIIVPSRLIGTWQDEIEIELDGFFSRRKNWNGKRFGDMRPNVIEYASDCRPENLRLFNIISYDRLKTTPRDACFYKCPTCGMVICSHYEIERPLCPGDPACTNIDPAKDVSCIGTYRRWKANKSRIDPETGKKMYRKYKVNSVTGEEVHWDASHWSRADTPDSMCDVVDTRDENPFGGLMGGPPDVPVMRRMDKMYEKTSNVIVAWQDTKDADGNNVSLPVFRKRHRKCNGKKFHVKWTFAELLRNRFGTLILDEIMCIQDARTLRSMSVNHLTGKTRIGATGTPMRGHPQKILAYVNFTTSREVFPDYRPYDKDGLARFLSRYKTTVRVGNSGQKQTPRISNSDRFLTEFSSMLLRRVRGEPGVREYLPDIKVSFNDIAVDMDDKHRAYYQIWLDLFREWWAQKKIEEDGEDTKGVKEPILAKIIYLIGASTCPHGVLANLIENTKKRSGDKILAKWAKIIPPYSGPPPAKTIMSLNAIKTGALKGDKVIVFSTRQKTLDLGEQCCDKLGLRSMVIDGRVSNTIQRTTSRSLRHLMVQKFRTEDYNAIWAGITCLSEGMNIPEANIVLLHDTTWEPMDIMQGVYRVVRPSQTKPVFVTLYMHSGTIDDYMVGLNYLKHRSHCEGVDGQSFSDMTGAMIPDIRQYADSIVDGTEATLKRKMWLQIDKIRGEWENSAKEHIDDEDDDDQDDEE